MKDQVYEIDENGFIVEIYVEDFDEDENPINKLPTNLITIRPPDGLFRAKWTGTEWVEGKPQEEFDYDKMVDSLNPTQSNIDKAEFEIRVINTLMEVGLI